MNIPARGWGLRSILLGSLSIGFTCAMTRTVVAAEIVVKTAAEAKSALSAAKPGDIITLENGDYDLEAAVTLSQQASETAPLIIRARSAGGAHITGKSGFVFDRASYITLSGLDFATETIGPVAILGSHYIRITENRFHVTEPGAKDGKTGPALRWVRISSSAGAGGSDSPRLNSGHNRIDHNLFEGKHTPGNYVGIDGLNLPYPKAQISQYDRIDHNIFADIGPRIPNGMEAIRVGLSGLSLSSSFTVIEDNLFENCDGDPEVASIKTCDAVVRDNTFRRCEGGLCLRHGNRNVVTGNRFFGEGKKGTLGVRVYGDDHRIEGNYFQGLTGPALTVSNGNADYGADYTKGEPLPSDASALLRSHLRPRRVTLRANIITDCPTAIELGAPYGDRTRQVPAQDIRFEGNLLVAADNPKIGEEGAAKLVWVRNPTERLTWRANALYASPGFPLVGGVKNLPPDALKIIRTDTPPKLALPGGTPGTDTGPSWIKTAGVAAP